MNKLRYDSYHIHSLVALFTVTNMGREGNLSEVLEGTIQLLAPIITKEDRGESVNILCLMSLLLAAAQRTQISRQASWLDLSTGLRPFSLNRKAAIRQSGIALQPGRFGAKHKLLISMTFQRFSTNWQSYIAIKYQQAA